MIRALIDWLRERFKPTPPPSRPSYELVLRVDGPGRDGRFVWSLTAIKGGGSGYWSVAPQPWTVRVGDEIVSDGTWTYDFRFTDEHHIAAGRSTLRPDNATAFVWGFPTLTTRLAPLDCEQAGMPATPKENEAMTDTAQHHHVQLKIEDGELHRGFVCTAPEAAPCRRRPPDADERESWRADEATETGHPCWAVDWVEAVGVEDAIVGHPDTVLASVPVTISFEEGVGITPANPAAPAGWVDPEPWLYYDGTRRAENPYPEGSENPYRVLWTYSPRSAPEPAGDGDR